MSKSENVEILESDQTYVKFNKKYQFEGQTYDGISLNLNDLTGDDIEQAEVAFINMNPQIAAQTPLKELSKGFQALIAARAARKPIEFIKKLPASDYAKVTTTVMTFLLKGDSEKAPAKTFD